MILPLVISISLSIDRTQYIVDHKQNNITYSVDYDTNKLYTTQDINPNPYDYIKQKNSSLLYEKLGEELLQEEAKKKKQP